MTKYVPVSEDDAVSFLSELVHTGFRKGSYADDAHDIWMMISKSCQKHGAYGEAIEWTVWCLSEMGMKICKEEE